MDNPSSTDSQGPSTRRKALSYLTAVSHGSSPFITTFLLIHLSAPVLANLGGSSLSSQVMLLGREYYQTSFGENYLLLTPLILHASSGIAKRLLSSHPTTSPRPVSSILSITAYGTLIFLPIHFAIHRLYPPDPSMLDYEFVKLGLHTWPVRSWLLYGGLVGCVLLHAAEGINIIGSTWAGRVWARWKSRRSWRLAVTVGAVPILTGLLFIFQEPIVTLPSLARQFEEAFKRSFIYRL
ncbi:hypothetical protein PILCRDRAFT_63587 [Piloderma croceum F 1598]|uniref:Mitochondrial adapter protein MCP1 transmembrane domain-containing protein n=1 Tax=Piloderma croceum (strain F 1598) TaxID=765440 RepID=A0A0C3CCH0_PILCF|nr:hypothetical protein PILCRDRAFT_63587 [Piloderma croceum F 1598]